MNDHKRVLIISTKFPPSIGSGVQRVMGFFKYLPDFGWDPYVLTIVPGPYHVADSPQEAPQNRGPDRITRTRFFDIRLAGKRLLLRAAGKGASLAPAEVVRTRATGGRWGKLLWGLANTFVFVPDPEVGWLPFGVRAGLSVIRKAGIDVIVSSAPPFTAHLIALSLKRRTGKPWVADFRDPWSQNPYLGLGRFRAIRQPVDRILERKVMKLADVIVSDTGPRAAAFARLKVRDIRRKLHVISNGYDPNEFSAVTRRPRAGFTITYTGSFYGAVRSPVPFMAALGELIHDGVLRGDRVRVRIIETFSQDTARLAATYGLSDVVTVCSGLSHTDAVREQLSASVLLLIIRNDSGGIGECPGKLFEYLGARRPILALAPKKGAAAEVIREANAGTVVDAGSRREVKEAILSYYSEHERTGTLAYHGRDEVIRRYERPALAGQLARVLDSLAPG